jgi:hypothetical protein
VHGFVPTLQPFAYRLQGIPEVLEEIGKVDMRPA